MYIYITIKNIIFQKSIACDKLKDQIKAWNIANKLL